MLVQNWMSRPVITIDVDADMPKAAELLKISMSRSPREIPARLREIDRQMV